MAVRSPDHDRSVRLPSADPLPVGFTAHLGGHQESEGSARGETVWAVVGGIVATLLGVALGAILTGRSQDSSWTRDRQLEVYAAVIREGTRIQLELCEQFERRSYRIDWQPWNEALAMISLVGRSDLVLLAQRMDEALWTSGNAVRDGSDRSFQRWLEIRQPLEDTRLAFLNVARQAIAKDGSVISRLVARPAESNLLVAELRAQVNAAGRSESTAPPATYA